VATLMRRLVLPKPNDDLIRPIVSSGRAFYLVGLFFSIVVAWFLFAWYLQLTEGLAVTDLRTPVGPAWGVYIAQFVFFVGIAHGGIAIAAAIKLLKLKSLGPVARVGEVLTVISVMMAGLTITIDMGRPDRIFNLVLYWPSRVGTSPLVWDVTVIIIYLTLSTSFLWLTMRKDLAGMVSRFPKMAPLYRLLSVGYHPGEEAKVEKMTWWLSIAVCFLIVFLSGGVVPWIFGLLSSRPGWYSALAGPYFLTAAISSAIAMVLVVAGVLRTSYSWDKYIKPQVFKGLGTFLGVITLFYVYMIFAEQLTMQFSAPVSELLVSDSITTGPFASVFWPMLVLGFIGPALTLVAQAVRPKWFSLSRTVFASGAIVIAFWIKRFLIVVPSLLRPLLPFADGSYAPSWVEWSIIAGILSLGVLLFMAFVRLFPIIELHEAENAESGEKRND
jgi:Ni/Fe-hydrogenase subunit HybB-like protein